MNLSVVILTKNEEKNISACINEVSFADEILLIDDFSQDKTIDNAKKNKKVIVFKRNLNNDFASQRNFGLKKAKSNWVLFVDADERVSKELADEIILATQNNKINGAFIKRVDVMWGKELPYGDVKDATFLRLVKKNSGRWSGKVHEILSVSGATIELKTRLTHYPHPTIQEFLLEIDHYSTLRAQELFENKKKVTIVEIMYYPIIKYFYIYFFRQGFRDGLRGLIHSIMMSFYSFLVRGKLYLLYK